MTSADQAWIDGHTPEGLAALRELPDGTVLLTSSQVAAQVWRWESSPVAVHRIYYAGSEAYDTLGNDAPLHSAYLVLHTPDDAVAFKGGEC